MPLMGIRRPFFTKTSWSDAKLKIFRTKRYTALALLLLLSLCACGEKPSQLEQDVKYLCSDQCGGRLPGTPGNEEAGKYIAAAFQAAELEYLPGLDSYFQPYTQEVFNPEEQEQTLTAFFPDGTSTVYHAGQDFYPYLNLDGGFSGEVTTDLQDPNLKDKILLAEPGSTAHGKVTVLRSDVTQAQLIRGSGAPQFRLNSAVYDAISGSERVTLEGAPITHEEQVNNVVGVLRGTGHTNALLITAHFDHLGRYGDVLYEGAFDNASGVGTMLEVLRQMTASESRPPYDILFVGFNGEEMGQPGSQAFAALDLPYETMNVINLDSLGLAGYGTIGVTNTDEALADQVLQKLQGAGLESKLFDGEIISDHLSFQPLGIPTVNLSSHMPVEELSKKVNIQTDVSANLDYEALNRLAAAVKAYALDADFVAQTPPPSDSAALYSPEEEAAWQEAYAYGASLVEKIQPSFTEQIPFALNGEFYTVQDLSWLASVPKAQALLPEAYFPEKLGAFSLSLDSPLNTPFNYETPQYSLGVYRASPLAEDDLEQPQPVPDESLDFPYSLFYQNADGEELALSAYRRDESCLSEQISNYQVDSETLPSGATLYLRYTDTEKTDATSYGVVYDHPDSPCVFTLIEMERMGPATIQTLRDLIISAEPELMKMRQLP